MYIQLFLVLKPQVWGKKPRFEHIKKEKISMKVNLFSKKNVIFKSMWYKCCKKEKISIISINNDASTCIY